MKNPIMIEFQNVTKTYPTYSHVTGGFKNMILNPIASLKGFQKSFTALKDMNFQIEKGETVAFVGRNGAGKSTTLGLIAGVLKPNTGTVQVNGRVSPLLELGGGFHPDLTGKENIELNGVLLGLSLKEVRSKTRSIIEYAELGEFIDQPVRMYSSGMVSRLGFSIVAHLNPEILLIDEVLAVGDQNFQKKCIETMLDFKKRGVTIVFVSHSPGDVLRLCDRAIWVENHQIKMDGPSDQVIAEYSKV